MSHRFENWSGTVSFKPETFVRPRSEAEVCAIVSAAVASSACVRTQGAGHSFSPILTTRDTLLKLDRMEPEDVTVNGKHVTVPGGMPLKTIIKELKKRRLALRNIGSVTEQSIAGAFSTGTHGTGLGYGSLASQVVSMKLVNGHGQAVHVTSPAELAAARVSVGMLGIITEVTLDCVDYFDLEYSAYLCRFEDIVTHLGELMTSNERALLWWLRLPFGPQDRVIVVTKNPVGAPPGFPATEPHVTDHGLLAFSGGLSFDAGVLAGIVAGIDLAPGQFRRLLNFREGYEDVLTLPLLPVYHRECEYAVPIAAAGEALSRFRAILTEMDASLLLPIEVRVMAEESSLLSVSNGRTGGVCYIGASPGVSFAPSATEIYERFEPLMRSLGGRPHWGKHFSLTPDDLRAMYPTTFDAFVRIRRQFDPSGVFLNSFLRGYFE